MEGFETKVAGTVEEYHMLEPGDRVIAAVSGGADSVCLLALLGEMRASRNIRLRAVHVHHGLREGEADRDAGFVQNLCSTLAVPCHIIRVNVRARAAQMGLSEEEAGRFLRYEILEQEACAWEEEDLKGYCPVEGESGGDAKGEATWKGGALGEDLPKGEAPGSSDMSHLRPVRVAVAHHRDDQAETILHNMFRGSGLLGLRGIPYVRGRIIRPLLDCDRSQILKWLSERGLSYVEDSTNSQDCYTRNRIRRSLIPRIEREVNRGAVGNLLRLGRLAGQADGYLRDQARLWIEGNVLQEGAVPDQGEAEGSGRLPRWEKGAPARWAVIPAAAFQAQPEILQSYIVLELFKSLWGQGKDLGERHVRQVMDLMGKPVGRRVDLPWGMRAVREYQALRLAVGVPEDGEALTQFPKVETEIFSWEKGMDFPKKMYTKWFDCDKIEGTPVVRSRQAGDYITLAEGKTKTVKRFMIDEKIPRQMRDKIPLLADGSHVMWIIGWRISQFYKIGPDTKRIYEARAIYPEEDTNNHNGG